MMVEFEKQKFFAQIMKNEILNNHLVCTVVSSEFCGNPSDSSVERSWKTAGEKLGKDKTL